MPLVRRIYLNEFVDFLSNAQIPRFVLQEAAQIFLNEILSNGLWPVRTGRSLAGFRASVEGQSIVISNFVPYAIYVEANFGALDTSINLALPSAIALVRRYAAGADLAAAVAAARAVGRTLVREEAEIGA